MARKVYPYSLDRKDAKVAGVCSTLGKRYGIDPTFIRIAWVAIPLLTPVSFVQAFVAYAIVGLVLALQKRRAMRDETPRKSDFERMDTTTTVRPSVHKMRTELDPIDRRMMAIDAHLSKPNDDLAREIDALREEK
jgi:phage shock protein PspC (stress-responsive transcriptional regulator)